MPACAIDGVFSLSIKNGRGRYALNVVLFCMFLPYAVRLICGSVHR